MSADESLRTRLLDAGLAILKEKGLGEIRLLDLTRAVKTSNGAFYHTWPDGLAGYVRDLTAHALDRAHSAYLDSIFEQLGEVTPADLPLGDVARVLGRRDSEGIDEAPAFRAQIALWPEAERNQSILDELRRQYQHFAQTIYVPAYTTLIDRYDLEMRPPFTVTTFATALTALAEGLALRRAVDPEGVKPPNALADEGWDLFGILSYALLGILARPRKGSDVRAALDLVDDLLRTDAVGGAAKERADELRTYRKEMANSTAVIEAELCRLRELHTKATGIAESPDS
jgi:AcrR family transcriptional regulator